MIYDSPIKDEYIARYLILTETAVKLQDYLRKLTIDLSRIDAVIPSPIEVDSLRGFPGS
jgi:hypothetical protein